MTVDHPAISRLRHFKRGARVTVYRESAPLYDDTFVVGRKDADANGVVIEALRMEFDIQRTLKKHPNSCSLKLTNLNAGSRAAFERKPLQVVIEAGYDGLLRRIYSGDIVFGMSTKDGPNWTTLLQLGDSDRVYKAARMNHAYTAGTSVKTALRDAAASIGQVLPREVEASRELDAQFGTGVICFGSLRDELSRLLKPYGYDWSFQDGKLQILRDDDDEGGDYVISEETGMIGSPEFGTPTRNGKPPHVTVRSLLYPEIRPGKTARVEARSCKGRFKIVDVKHRGDTHGDAWFTEIEIKPIQPSKPKTTGPTTVNRGIEGGAPLRPAAKEIVDTFKSRGSD